MTDIDTFIPWTAGFFDGEGSVNIVNNRNQVSGRNYHTLHVNVTQVDPRPLLEIRERWGGNICLRQPSTPRAKGAFCWSIRSAGAEKFLRDIRPWARVKGEQIDIALAFRETFRLPGGSARIPEGVIDLRNDLKRQLEEGRR